MWGKPGENPGSRPQGKAHAPQLLYPVAVPTPHVHSARAAPERQNRTARRYALYAISLLFLLLPVQGSIDSAASAAPMKTERVAAGAAQTPRVSLKMKQERVSTRQRARVVVKVHRPSAQQSVRSGRVEVVANGGGKSHTVRAPLVDGRAVATLPKLARGVYRVRATLLRKAISGGQVAVPDTDGRRPRQRQAVAHPTQVEPGQRVTASVEVSSGRRSVFGNVNVTVAGAAGSWTVAGQARGGPRVVIAGRPLRAWFVPRACQVRRREAAGLGHLGVRRAHCDRHEARPSVCPR